MISVYLVGISKTKPSWETKSSSGCNGLAWRQHGQKPAINEIETSETLLCQTNFLSYLAKGATKFLSIKHGQQQRNTGTQVLLGGETDENWQAAAAGRKMSTQPCLGQGSPCMGRSLSAACLEAAGSLANAQYRRGQSCQFGPTLLSLDSVWMGPT